ncbi:amidase domain-containing protein [Staphylococcus pragensis]|uniref:Amidase domain-containing protein n=1 Tax=Staphylococcus pragensis TaxID=1611836 RepID=A0A4Z1ATH8_9STAP|nr:amidase domain-containing protein [Staphylococcus pragensis]RTX90219.1 amidase domain-containing protein [Staphylococcus carnosus]TGN22293.1 amidase domain-containing protein [Staphylococcus pragensis]GGG98694.1 N-acetylmuramoyl-L-alanine amidase [Staphylococcus pragensis]
MSKQKLMVYLLTTTLVFPTFTTSLAHAEDTTDESEASSSRAHSNEDAPSTEEDKTQEDTDTKDENNDDSTTSQEESVSTEEDNSEETSASHKETAHKESTNDKTTKKDKTTRSNRQQTNQSSSRDNAFYHTPLASFFDIPNLTGNHSSHFLDPNVFDNGFSLTNLIASLFNFDSDISDYEHVENSKEISGNASSENHSNTNDSNQSASTSQSSSIHSENSTQTDDATSEQSGSTEMPQHEKESDNTGATASSNESKDDASISKALDAIDDLVTDATDTQNSTDSNQSSNETTSNEDSHSSSEQPSSHASSQSDSESKGDSFSDSVLDSVLDQYSEDATKTHKDYESSKASGKTSVNKDKPSTSVNTQLPTKEELAHKAAPVQSFEDAIKRNNTRATSLFQMLPQLNRNSISDGNIAVVESKDTRDFIKSIAKDAHQIGQDQDIYASVMIAQAILESSSGQSALAQAPNYNLFGIKGAYQGQTVNFNTLEAGNDNAMFNIMAGFRKYPNTKASLEDYASLIKHGIDGNPSIYKGTWKSEAPTYRSATSHLSRTYATDPNYAMKLNSLIQHYNLTAFDKKSMPDLDKYAKSTSSGQNVSGGDFKPFAITDGATPYPQGQCTWYVYERVQQFGKHVSGNWGDAHHWDNRAERDSYRVTGTPKVHTVAVFERGQAGADSTYGHVAFVEKVNEDGSIIVSESNVKGLGIVSYRMIDADTAQALYYIEPK